MPILSVNKTADRTEISAGGTFHVTLSVTAAPESEIRPVDIAMVLDRSGSMKGSALQSLKSSQRIYRAAGARRRYAGGSKPHWRNQLCQQRGD